MILINTQPVKSKKEIFLPNLKSSFGSIDWHTPIILNVVGQNRIRKTRDVNRELPSAFLRFLNESENKGKICDWKKIYYAGKTFEGRIAHKKYLTTQIYSLALPTCIHFGLISQQKPYEMLTFYGRKLLQILEQENASQLSQSKLALDAFKKIVSQKDEQSWGIIRTLRKLKKANLEKLVKVLIKNGVYIRVSTKTIKRNAREKIIRALKSQGKIKNSNDIIRLSEFINEKISKEIQNTEISNRKNILSNLLNLFRHLKLIKKEGPLYYIDSDEINLIKNYDLWNETIENRKFFESLKTAYSNIVVKQGELVPIPIIRDEVCLMNDITWDLFNKKLVEIGYEFDGNRISLSRPIISKKWGIFIGIINYYYLSIMEVGG